MNSIHAACRAISFHCSHGKHTCADVKIFNDRSSSRKRQRDANILICPKRVMKLTLDVNNSTMEVSNATVCTRLPNMDHINWTALELQYLYWALLRYCGDLYDDRVSPRCGTCGRQHAALKCPHQRSNLRLSMQHMPALTLDLRLGVRFSELQGRSAGFSAVAKCKPWLGESDFVSIKSEEGTWYGQLLLAFVSRVGDLDALLCAVKFLEPSASQQHTIPRGCSLFKWERAHMGLSDSGRRPRMTTSLGIVDARNIWRRENIRAFNDEGLFLHSQDPGLWGGEGCDG